MGSMTFRIVVWAILYSLMSSSMLLVNKAALMSFPYSNTILLLQLATAALLSWGLGRLHCLGVEVDALDQSKIMSTLPLTSSFFLVLLTSMHALHHVNVDTMIVLKTCTPITVAVGEWLFVNTALPSARTWVSLAVVIISSAAAFSMQMAAITAIGALWLVLWFFSVTFYMVYSAHYVLTVKLTTMGRVFYENLFSCLFCIPLALATDLVSILTDDQQTLQQHQQLGDLFHAMPSRTAMLVGASCLMGFSMSWCGWALRQHITALSYTVLGVVNKLLTVLLNATVWNNHGPPMSQGLLIVGILAGSFYQQQSTQRSSWAGKRGSQAKPATGSAEGSMASQNGQHREYSSAGGRAHRLWTSLAGTAAGLALLVWIGVSLGRALSSSR